MKNVINFYYNMNVMNVYELGNKFYFNYNNKDYYFMAFDRKIEDAQGIYNLYVELKNRGIITNSIVVNKDNQIITFLDKRPYILIRDDVSNRFITINDIIYIQNNTVKTINDRKLFRNNWINLWQIKINYYEEQMNNISNKYCILKNSIDYYIGLGENAISYLVYNKIKNDNVCLSHIRIDLNKNAFDFYNPINYIIDNRVRDISEYIKNLYFYDNVGCDMIIYYLNYLNLNKEEYILLISRLLFPTYYFDVYDKILIGNLDEKIIEPIINKTNNYINLVKQIMLFAIYQKGFNIPFIDWIIKNTD